MILTNVGELESYQEAVESEQKKKWLVVMQERDGYSTKESHIWFGATTKGNEALEEQVGFQVDNVTSEFIKRIIN